MSQPNWDEAPEGATHHASKSGTLLKIDKDRVYFYRAENMGWEYTGFRLEDYNQSLLIPRPEPDADKPWDGTGLPKVGTVCEGTVLEDCWDRLEIVGYYHERQVWVRWFDGNQESFATYPVDEIEFRPIKTPEQIAAEEREKAVTDGLVDASTLAVHVMGKRTLIERLYDAGWRKVE